MKQEESKAYKCSLWFFQVIVWILLIITIIVACVAKDSGPKLLSLIIFCIAYFIYLLLEFCSPTSHYLCHKRTENGMYEKMGKLYQTYPVIVFHGESYHFETKIKGSAGIGFTGDANFSAKTKKEKVVTYREDYEMPYYSERDVSGLFYLDCDRAQLQKKIYIQLDLTAKIDFADPISYMDYKYELNSFTNNIQSRDQFGAVTEKKYIPGLTEHNLIKLASNEPCLANFFCFFLATLLTLGEIYTIYLNSISIKQRYTIRKLISTRYDLNQPRYNIFTPRLDLINQQFTYSNEYYNYINKDYNPKLPTEEEIRIAEQYKQYIPDYKISSGGGQIHAGVVLDDPKCSNNNLSPPQPAFSSSRMNVPINRNQINEKGEFQQNFGQAGFPGNNDDTIVENKDPGYNSKNEFPVNQQQQQNFNNNEFPINNQQGSNLNNQGAVSFPPNQLNSERQGFQNPPNNPNN